MELVNIRIGQQVIVCEVSLATQVGYGRPYANDETRTARGGTERGYGSGLHLTPDQALAIALSEGHTGEMAVMRAIAIRTQGKESAEVRGEREAAQLRATAAQAELRAEQIRSARQKRASA